jgi:hypothetical protein
MHWKALELIFVWKNEICMELKSTFSKTSKYAGNILFGKEVEFIGHITSPV